MLAVCAAALAAALAPPALAQSGGAPAPEESAAAVDPSFRLSSRRSVLAGRALRLAGTAPVPAGTRVRIERRDPAGWLPVAAADVRADGSYATRWAAPEAGRHTLRAIAEPAAPGAQSSSARPSSAPRTVTVYRTSRASWYGPGFYGRETACGIELTRRTVGVAHRTLPCGTRVAVLHAGRSIVVPVIDRGPYVRGVSWDLTEAAARRVRMLGTTTVGVAVVTP